MLNKKIKTVYEKIKTLTKEINQIFNEEEIKKIKEEYYEMRTELFHTALSNKLKVPNRLRDDNFWEINSVFSLIILKEHIQHEEEYNKYKQ